MSEASPIDVVIMWVDGSDQSFIELEKMAVAEEIANGRTVVTEAARHRDNGELKYVIRSVFYNLPWVRRIYVVTNGQKPTSVRFDAEKLVHVQHADIFPDCSVLPSFNTFAIESCVHRIPGLSNVFLRFSDDFFVGRPASRNDVLGDRGSGRFVFQGKVQVEPTTPYQMQISSNAALFERVTGRRPLINFGHAPQPRDRQVFEAFTDTFSESIDRTRRSRFRSKDDIISLFLYPYFHVMKCAPDRMSDLLAGTGDSDNIVQKFAIGVWFAQVLVGVPDGFWRDRLDRVLIERPLYVNLNDQFQEATRDKDLDLMIQFLEAMFPRPSPFEV
ncbi:stealth conserved region 3 domain-containing protein [Rhizobium laguerreae]|uniref:stealth conserved region 3 domain-containing protein n=1 Tax=Rhizobium laguerreae TaxID=1076926 RepID=UPI001C925F7F|nr:stealth conserved region 3 domain-containing protein [Rhizobium laguerreae]MBY3347972.1 hypothetical protein [Rhizobium laguerreae]MBY3354935.1 hypothetical protein [Rhizobium laguerreae]MBY3376240.1 hypothetical protein [Rhizobium laguerreae]MBY3431239.1 hypothetical protein [Rhizobium laguerreae]MBY3439855.1 hypothetical protein [Rhizobium laguerreae]